MSAVPNAGAVNIALAKKAKIVTGSEMPAFFAASLRANGGNPADAVLARFGGSVMVGGVRIATITALHSSVRTHDDARLAVMNIGDGFTTGPAAAAFVMNSRDCPAFQ